jgi:hypothetical protein
MIAPKMKPAATKKCCTVIIWRDRPVHQVRRAGGQSPCGWTYSLGLSSWSQPISSWKTRLNVLRWEPCVIGHFYLAFCFWLPANQRTIRLFQDEFRRIRQLPLPCRRISNIPTHYRRLREFPGARSMVIGLSTSKMRMRTTVSFIW